MNLPRFLLLPSANQEHDPMTDQPKTPRLPESRTFDDRLRETSPPQQFIPQHRRSEAYAAAQQEWTDLHQQLASMGTEVNQLRAQLSVCEESNKVLHEDLNNTKHDNERLVRENTMIRTRITSAAELLMSLMKLAPPVTTEPDVTQQVEEALKGGTVPDSGPVAH